MFFYFYYYYYSNLQSCFFHILSIDKNILPREHTLWSFITMLPYYHYYLTIIAILSLSQEVSVYRLPNVLGYFSLTFNLSSKRKINHGIVWFQIVYICKSNITGWQPSTDHRRVSGTEKDVLKKLLKHIFLNTTKW